jgi:UPF0716 protein FxsA
MRRRIPWWVLALVFVVLPVVEIYVLIQIGQVIGAWWTVLLLIADGFLGSWLMKREGGRAWAALREALGSGRVPGRELADGALILVGGTLLMTPGFVSDVAGLFLVLPVTRWRGRWLPRSNATTPRTRCGGPGRGHRLDRPETRAVGRRIRRCAPSSWSVGAGGPGRSPRRAAAPAAR